MLLSSVWKIHYSYYMPSIGRREERTHKDEEATYIGRVIWEDYSKNKAK